jgi:LAO/AO transport system ATPase
MRELFAGLKTGDRRSLARLITLISRNQQLDEIRAQLGAPSHARVIAFTGGGGVGKSTLVGKLIEKLREHSRSVAVLACDPESPLTGGALLGDRFRMPSRPNDAGVFIRSLAAPSGRQAVADHLDLIVTVCAEFGFDFVLIETVGAGQGDTAVRSVADAVVLLLQPETGDELQWEKAGVLEVADAIVVHKADLPGADKTVAQVKSALELAMDRAPPVLSVSSRSGAGLDQLAAWVEAIVKRTRTDEEVARELLRLAQQELTNRLPKIDVGSIASAWKSGRLTREVAIRQVFERLSRNGAALPYSEHHASE